MTLAIHNIFFAVTTLEKVQRIGKIILLFFSPELRHKVNGRADNNVFDSDSVGTGLTFKIEIFDTLINTFNQMFRI